VFTLLVGGLKYRFVAFEGDIEDRCIVGMDFMRPRGGIVDTKRLLFALDHPLEPTVAISVPFSLQFSCDAGKFGANAIFAVVRATVKCELQPFGSATMSAKFSGPPALCGEVQVKVARLLRARCIQECDGTLTEVDMDRGRSVPLIQGQGPIVSVASCELDDSRGTMELNRSLPPRQAVSELTASGSCGAPAGGSDTTPTPFSEGQGSSRLADDAGSADQALRVLGFGLVVPSVNVWNKQCGFPMGLVPVAPGQLEISVTNHSADHVIIPKGTAVAYVHPMGLEDLGLPCDDCAEHVMVRSASLYGEQAEVELTPRLPPISQDQPLPDDLQGMVDRCEALTEDQKQTVANVVRQYHDIFVKHNDDFGCCPWVKFRIDTGDHPPIKQQARPIPIHQREELAALYRRYLEQGTVRPSQSPWASPLMLIKKKTLDAQGKPEMRAVIDYRKLNAVTRVPAIPIPRTQELLEKLGGHKWYVHADLASGYHNLQVAEEDIQKTAVALPDSLGLPSRFFEYTRLPFGLSAAPGVFQSVTDRLMRPSLRPTLDDDIGPASGVYLDDLCVAGDEFPQMLQRIKALFNRIRASGFLLKAKKCFLFKCKLKFLGFVLSTRGISTDSAKVEKITHWPAPVNVTELRSWMGLVGFYARFIDHMAEKASPLYDLYQDKVPFVWTSACQHAFEQLKKALSTDPVLGIADPNKGVFIVHCDASQRAVACILSQEQDGRQVVLHYHSKQLPRLKRSLCATHAELYALVEATKAFRLYLLGRPFIFYTDHAALLWLRSFKNVEGKLARWLMRLEEFRFEIRHMKGKELTNADALSRRPSRPCEPDCRTCLRLEEREVASEQNYEFQVKLVTICPLGEWESDEVSNGQQVDPDIGPIYVAVQLGQRPHFQEIVGFGPVTRSLWMQFRSLFLENGVLKRRFEHPSGDPSLAVGQIVVPMTKVKDLVVQFHQGPSSGSHFGVSKTHALLKQRFYWPGMFQTVVDCVACCLRCVEVKGPQQKTRAPMKVFREGVLFGRWHADFVGPFELSSPDKYRYVLVLVEAFSSWPEAIPIRTLKAPEVADALVRHVFSRLGAPHSIVTDQGGTFESKLFKEVLAIYKTRKCRVSPGKPSSNGKVENYIRSLTRQIALLANESPSNWPDLIPHILHSYRASAGAVTGFSPYEILFGRPMRVPLDLAFGVPPVGEPSNVKRPEQYTAMLRERLDKIHSMVRNNIHSAASRMKDHYDKLSTLVYFKPGDVVLLYNRRRTRGKSTKLYAPWHGPYVITDMLNDCIARIEEVRPKVVVSKRQRKPRRIIVHVDRLAAIGSQMVDQNGQWLKFADS